jgi:hypothetical protein
LKAFGSTGQASVYQHAKDLLNDICGWRITAEEKKRPIIFIAHSRGGIVVKDALGQSDAAVTHVQEVMPSVRGVCFLGTPHRGSGAASLGKIAAELSKYFFKKPNTQVLQTLEVNSSELDKTGTLFNQVQTKPKFQVHSFWEEKPQKGMIVVQNFSYCTGIGTETTGGIPASHSDMTKFVSNVRYWLFQDRICDQKVVEHEYGTHIWVVMFSTS